MGLRGIRTAGTYRETEGRACFAGLMAKLWADEDPFYSEENMERLRRSIAQLNAGKETCTN